MGGHCWRQPSGARREETVQAENGDWVLGTVVKHRASVPPVA